MDNADSSPVTATLPAQDGPHSSGRSGAKAKPRLPSDLFRRVPPFSVQRLLKAMSGQNSAQPVNIKQDNTVDLDKLSLGELNELLKRQEKLVQNKQLLGKLKDKGEKMIAFRDRIAAAIKLREDITSAEVMLGKLSLNSADDDQKSKPDHRIQILQKPPSCQNPLRFNVPQKLESVVKVPDLKSRDFKEVKVKLELPKGIQTLDWRESLQTLEATSQKNKSALADQILRLHSRGSEDEDKGELSEEEHGFDDHDDDADLHVNVQVHSAQ